MDKKINVLYLINYAGSGGSEKYLKILADNMKEDINSMLCYNEEGLLVSEFGERNIKCEKIVMRNPFDFKAAKELAKLVKDNNIDIIHSNYLRENYIAILSKLFGNKAKIVYTCHFNLYDSFIVKMMNKIFYKKLSKIISISNIVTDSLIKSGSPKDKIELIYHGVCENDKMSPDNYLKTTFGVSSDEFVISSASRFSPEKGNMFLIDSIKILKDKVNDYNKKVNEDEVKNVEENKEENIEENKKKNKKIKFKVLLANEGARLDDCKTQSQILEIDDVVVFLGYLKNNIEDLYLASDIYVTSSSNEGLGLATIESLNYGVPNVVTKIGGLTEIVNDKTNCGISVTYGDEYEMSDALFKIMTDDDFRNELKINAKKTIKEKFSIDQMINKTLNVYRSVLENK